MEDLRASMLSAGPIRLTAAQKAAIKEKVQKEDFAEFEPPQKILLAQRGSSFAVNVPTHLQHVFRPASREGELLQRQLRGRAMKAAAAMSNAATLPEYQCEFVGAREDGLYELGELSSLSDFLVREAKAHMDRRFTDSGAGRWLRNNIEMQFSGQDTWFRETLGAGRGHGREAQLDQMSRYCDKEDSITPLLLMGGMGSGKTALMMKFVEYYLDRWEIVGNTRTIMSKGWRHKAPIFVRSHFTTVNATSRNPANMLGGFCQAISEHYFFPEKEWPLDYASLCERFRSYVPRVGSSFRGDFLLVIVDSLEELDMWQSHSDRYVHDTFSCIDWIPSRLPPPPNFPVRIMVSIDHTAMPERTAQLRKRQSAFQVMIPSLLLSHGILARLVPSRRNFGSFECVSGRVFWCGSVNLPPRLIIGCAGE